MIHLAQITIGVLLMSASIIAANAHKRVAHSHWGAAVYIPLLGAFAMWFTLNSVLAISPVLRDVVAVQLPSTAGLVRMTIIATKVEDRGCRAKHVDAYVIDASGIPQDAAFSIEDDWNPGNSRPAGRHNFGIWRVAYPVSVNPIQVEFAVEHDCGGIWRNRESVLGPFAVVPP